MSQFYKLSIYFLDALDKIPIRISSCIIEARDVAQMTSTRDQRTEASTDFGGGADSADPQPHPLFPHPKFIRSQPRNSAKSHPNGI